MYFKTTITYKKPVEGEEDQHKQVKEHYLINAVSVTDAETKILKELPDNYHDKDVKGVTASNVTRVIFSTGEKWFVTGVKYATGTNKKGETAYSYETIMINGDNIDHALGNLRINHKDTVEEYIISSLQESKMIVDRSMLTTDHVIDNDE